MDEGEEEEEEMGIYKCKLKGVFGERERNVWYGMPYPFIMVFVCNEQ